MRVPIAIKARTFSGAVLTHDALALLGIAGTWTIRIRTGQYAFGDPDGSSIFGTHKPLAKDSRRRVIEAFERGEATAEFQVWGSLRDLAFVAAICRRAQTEVSAKGIRARSAMRLATLVSRALGLEGVLQDIPDPSVDLYGVGAGYDSTEDSGNGYGYGSAWGDGGYGDGDGYGNGDAAGDEYGGGAIREHYRRPWDRHGG